MARVTLQFFGAQVRRGTPFIVDDASAHAVGFILAQKDGAVGGIGDTGWLERAFHTAGIIDAGYNFHYPGFTLLPSPAFLLRRFRRTVSPFLSANECNHVMRQRAEHSPGAWRSRP